MNRTILIVDDEAAIRKSLEGALTDEDYTVLTAPGAMQAFEMIRKAAPHLILLDIWMPEMDGLVALTELKNQGIDIPVIMMSGHGNVETAVKATKLGAFDFVEKPIELDRLLVLIRNAILAKDLATENQALRKQLSTRRPLIGTTPAIEHIRELIRKVAPTPGSVLITGENGTGKEVVAQTIHALSNRFKKPFIEVNCAAIPEELIESELFGHVKGAFTGAVFARRGKFDLADGGTIFLDEIGDMSLKTQAKILRILQEQRFDRVGGQDSQKVDVRVIAATNKDLKSEMSRELFREDLYFRLNVLHIHLPPLRERTEDIRGLADYFFSEFATTYQKPKQDLAPDAIQLMQRYDWPGNVRELRNLVERMVILQENQNQTSGNHPTLTARDIRPHLDSSGAPITKMSKQSDPTLKPLKDAKSDFEKDYILQALRENDWNISKTAQKLEIERSYLHRRMKAFGIDHAQD